MSKAFTRESDDTPERPTPLRPAAVLPPGAKNLITPGGALRARAELENLFPKSQNYGSQSRTGTWRRHDNYKHLPSVCNSFSARSTPLL